MAAEWLFFAGEKAMKTCLAIWICALLGAIGAPAFGQGHDFTGRCGQCHLEDAPAAGDSLRADIETLCRRCHRLPQRYSHPSGVRPAQELPPAFAGFGQGLLTCTTCHDPHPDPARPAPYLLRTAAAAGAFCEQCHPLVEEGTGRHLAVTPLAHRKTGLDRGTAAGDVDDPTLRCLSCHDGTNARAVTYCLADERSNCNSHVVGIAYARAAAANRKLAAIDVLAPEIFLPGGRVSCLSCHSPYSGAPSMVVSTVAAGYKICTECHRM